MLAFTRSSSYILLHTELAGFFESLGDLPLAITQAPAFMTDDRISISENLKVLRANRSDVEDLLGEEMEDQRRYSESGYSILGTLKLSFDQKAKQKPLAAEILSFMAFLDRGGIPRSLLKRQNVRTVEFVSALGYCKPFLSSRTKKEKQVLTCTDSCRFPYSDGYTKNWQDEVVEVLSEKFPPGDYNNRKECEQVAPHALVAIDYDIYSLASQQCRATILDNLAHFDREQSRDELAEKRYM